FSSPMTQIPCVLEEKIMKRLISAVLALSLLGTAAASAQPFGGSYGPGISRDVHRGWNSGPQRDFRGADRYGYRDTRRRNDGAALIGLGIGLFALAAIASQQHDDRAYRYDDGYYGR